MWELKLKHKFVISYEIKTCHLKVNSQWIVHCNPVFPYHILFAIFWSFSLLPSKHRTDQSSIMFHFFEVTFFKQDFQITPLKRDWSQLDCQNIIMIWCSNMLVKFLTFVVMCIRVSNVTLLSCLLIYNFTVQTFIGKNKVSWFCNLNSSLNFAI